jgi:VanZ family protein
MRQLGYSRGKVLTVFGVLAWIVLAAFALRGARWAYAVFLLLGLFWIPGSAGFHLHHPDCEGLVSFDLALFSLTNYKHIFLFGVFFLMTRVQLGRARHALLLAAAATIAMGVLIELEEGATNRHCRLRDLAPDCAGALAGAVVWRIWRRPEATSFSSG